MPVEANLEPDTAWTFDREVAEHFDDMLRRSIPGYDEMRRIVEEIAVDRIDSLHGRRSARVLDLGCSRGNALARIVDNVERPDDLKCLGIDVSPEMADVARQRFADVPQVQIAHGDVRSRLSVASAETYDVVLAVLTYQFIPIEDRQLLVDNAAHALAPGGAMIVVEKCLGTTGRATAFLDRIYYDRKRANGYTDDEIAAKRESLSGVMVPQTERANVDMLRSAGLEVEPIWRALQFAGWVATKPR